ncbi:MAG TPA: RDD family protein [Tepidisphaeraceae bacterium]|nr:RDD family protein [Tepidisphaeraceae bacterium]
MPFLAHLSLPLDWFDAILRYRYWSPEVEMGAAILADKCIRENARRAGVEIPISGDANYAQRFITNEKWDKMSHAEKDKLKADERNANANGIGEPEDTGYQRTDPVYRLRRTWAFVADAIAFFIFSCPLWYICLSKSFENQQVEGSLEYWATYGSFVFFTGAEVFPGQTLGKWLLGLRIVDRGGRRLSRTRSAARWLVKYLPVHWTILGNEIHWSVEIAGVMACYVAAIGSSLLMLSGRTIHDLVAGTKVVRKADA